MWFFGFHRFCGFDDFVGNVGWVYVLMVFELHGFVLVSFPHPPRKQRSGLETSFVLSWSHVMMIVYGAFLVSKLEHLHTTSLMSLKNIEVAHKREVAQKKKGRQREKTLC